MDHRKPCSASWQEKMFTLMHVINKYRRLKIKTYFAEHRFYKLQSSVRTIYP
jgi:hypothetical protein